MKKFIIKKELMEDCKKFLNEELDIIYNDKKYYARTLEVRGSDKKWLERQIFKTMQKENRLNYLLYILEMNLEAYEEAKIEKKMQEQLSVF